MVSPSACTPPDTPSSCIIDYGVTVHRFSSLDSWTNTMCLTNTCSSINSSSCMSLTFLGFFTWLMQGLRFYICVTHRTFAELGTTTSISPSHALLITPISPGLNSTPVEISVVYYHTGYTPTDYVSSANHATRALFEHSHTI